MKLLKMLKTRNYLILTIVSAILMGAFYTYTQVLFVAENIEIWLTHIPIHNLILYVIFSGVFGLTLSFQIWVRKTPQTCDIRKASGMSGGASAAAFLVAQCPACASLGALFLPLSVIGAINVFGPIITLATIAIMIFTLHYLGAFKKA